MIPQSILDMINDATQKAYILATLEYIKEECKRNEEFCSGCLFYTKDEMSSCFFNSLYHEGVVPEEWDIEKLEKMLKGECQ